MPAASAVRKNAPTLYRLRTLSSRIQTGSAKPSYTAPAWVARKGTRSMQSVTSRVRQELAKERGGTLKIQTMLSIVIPIHNEEHSLLPLYDRLTLVLEALQRPYEILFVDEIGRAHV